MHGHMVFTQRVLGSRFLRERFRLLHVDISDHRGFDTLGRFDLLNVVLAALHLWRMTRVLLFERPHVVHVPLSQNMLGLGRDLVFVAVALLGRARVVGHVHGGGLGSFLATAPRWFSVPARSLLGRCAALVVMTRSQGEQLAAQLPRHRMVVLAHGTASMQIAPRAAGDRPLRALYVSSNLQASKGLWPMLDAAVQAQREKITVCWDVVGAWLNEETRVEAQDRVRGVDGIRFHGELEPELLVKRYSDADVFVFPTGETEGFALVRIEAMAAGLPVLTTPAGGGAEIVRDGQDGFIVDYDDPQQIVSRLKMLRADPELLAELSRSAHERQRDSFSISAFEQGLAALYARVAADHELTNSDREASRLIVIGPTPPPLHGGAFANIHVLEGLRRARALAAHVDTSDPRPVWTTNRVDPLNVWLAGKHACMLVAALVRDRGADVYVPVSQVRWGFLRDALLIAIARLARRRILIHLHGGLFAQFYSSASGPERALIRWSLRGIWQAWVLTEAHRGMFDGLVSRDRVRVLENCGDDMGPPERAGGGRPVRLLYLANLFPEKGSFTLLDALDLLGARARDFSLRLVGEAEPVIAEQVRSRCGALVERGVDASYIGPLVGADKHEQYARAEVFVLPSHYPPEGQPLVLLEAMSAGLAIVSTDHSGIPWTVLDEQQGLIIPPNDPKALADALQRLLDDPDLLERLGRSGRERYEAVYTPEAFYDRLATLVDEIPLIAGHTS